MTPLSRASVVRNSSIAAALACLAASSRAIFAGPGGESTRWRQHHLHGHHGEAVRQHVVQIPRARFTLLVGDRLRRHCLSLLFGIGQPRLDLGEVGPPTSVVAPSSTGITATTGTKARRARGGLRSVDEGAISTTAEGSSPMAAGTQPRSTVNE